MQQVTLVTADYRQIAIPNNQDTVETAVLTGRFQPTDGREPNELPVHEARQPVRRYRKADGTEVVCVFDEGMQEIVDAEWKRCREEIDAVCRERAQFAHQLVEAVGFMRRVRRAGFWTRLKALFVGGDAFFDGERSRLLPDEHDLDRCRVAAHQSTVALARCLCMSAPDPMERDER